MKLEKQLVSMDYFTASIATDCIDNSSGSFQDSTISGDLCLLSDSVNYHNFQIGYSSPEQYNAYDEPFESDHTNIRNESREKEFNCRPSSIKKVSRTSRIMRNVAEKQRRDKLNNCISKLASMVPLVSLSNKRMNKSAILRLAASYLRLHSGIINGLVKEYMGNFFPLQDGDLSRLLLELTEGFAVITNESLKVLFVSDLIENLLRHSVVDVLGQSFYSLIHPDDHSILQEKIVNTERSGENAGNFSLYCSMMEGNSEGKSKPNCRLMRIFAYKKSFTMTNGSSQERNGTVYVFIVKLCLVQPRNSIAWTTNPNEITFRSAFTGRCLFVDHKLSILLGIMPSEIEGSSGYDWIYKEDHPIAAVAHTQMLSDGFYRGIPIRLVTRNKTAIYFMTAGKLVSTVEGGASDLMYMVCTMISNDEGERIQALVRHRLANQLGTCKPRDFDNQLEDESNGNKVADQESSSEPLQPAKRPRGRPRKYPLNSAVALKPRRVNSSVNGNTKHEFIDDIKCK
ncbi:hypothetical protein CHUAL_008636 [Chamberlinius hualienensis]